MGFITLTSGLTIQVPTRATRNWADNTLNEAWKKISAHDHTGGGKGLQIGTNALGALAVTTAKVADAAITTAKLASDVGVYQTGDIKMSFRTSASSGFLLLVGGTIGNAASGASVRANADTSALFTYLWNNLANSQAPVSTGRGVSAAVDFAANKTITLPDYKNKSPIGKGSSGTAATMGNTFGAIDHTHDMSNHTHTGGAHTHDLGNHTHTGPSHQHDVQNTRGLATVYSFAAANRFAWVEAAIGGTYSPTKEWLIGAATSGYAGSGETFGIQNNGFTDAAGTGATGAPSSNTSGSGGAVTSGTPSNNTSGAANHPCFVCNFEIKL